MIDFTKKRLAGEVFSPGCSPESTRNRREPASAQHRHLMPLLFVRWSAMCDTLLGATPPMNPVPVATSWEKCELLAKRTGQGRRGVLGTGAGKHPCPGSTRASSPGFGLGVPARAVAVLAFVSMAVLGAPSAYALDIGGAVTNNFQAWQPSNSTWVPGNATGYAEGDVVALSVEIDGGTGNNKGNPSTQYQIQICLDYNYQGGNTKYAFIDDAPWNTFSPAPSVRGGPITGTLGAAATDWGTINSVTTGAPNSCPPNFLSYDVTFTTGAAPAPSNFYIYFGARVAKAGLVTELGATVPAGGGVSSWPVGTFQTSLRRTTGNKTVNFKPGDFATASACQIVRMTSSAAVTPPGSVLLGTGLLKGTCSGTNCSLTINTTDGMFSGKGLIYNDGQFPVSAGCGGPAEECFATQSTTPPSANPFPTTSPGFDLNGLTLTPGTGGGSIVFGAGGSYNYTAGKFGSHSGTYRIVDCTNTVPEPGTLALALLSLVGLALAGRRQARQRPGLTTARNH